MSLLRTRKLKWAGPLGLVYASYKVWRRHLGRDEPTAGEHAPSDEIVPADLTSPGTVSDPELEERRAEEAAERERESRASPITKFDELRLQEDGERHEHAAVVADVPPPAN